jgi:hypothetical protein
LVAFLNAGPAESPLMSLVFAMFLLSLPFAVILILDRSEGEGSL